MTDNKYDRIKANIRTEETSANCKAVDTGSVTKK